MGVEFVLWPYSRRCTCESYGASKWRQKRKENMYTLHRGKIEEGKCYIPPATWGVSSFSWAIPPFLCVCLDREKRPEKGSLLLLPHLLIRFFFFFFSFCLSIFLKGEKAEIFHFCSNGRVYSTFKHKHNCGNKNRREKEALRNKDWKNMERLH